MNLISDFNPFPKIENVAVTADQKNRDVSDNIKQVKTNPTDRATVEFSYKDVTNFSAGVPTGTNGMRAGIALAIVVLASACLLVSIAAVVQQVLTWSVVVIVAFMLSAAIALAFILHRKTRE